MRCSSEAFPETIHVLSSSVIYQMAYSFTDVHEPYGPMRNAVKTPGEYINRAVTPAAPNRRMCAAGCRPPQPRCSRPGIVLGVFYQHLTIEVRGAL